VGGGDEVSFPRDAPDEPGPYAPSSPPPIAGSGAMGSEQLTDFYPPPGSD